MVLPFAVALAILGLATALGRAASTPLRSRVAASLFPLAIGVASAAGIAAIFRAIPPLPPHESADCLFFICLVVGVLESLLILFNAPPWLARVSIFLLTVLSLRAALDFQFRATDGAGWSTRTGCNYLALLGLLAVAMWSALRRAARDNPSLSPLITTGVAALAAVLLMTGCQLGGQIAGVIAAASAAELLAKLLFMRRLSPVANITGAAVFCVAITVLLTTGPLLFEMSRPSARAFAAAPLLLFIAILIPLSRRPPWQRILIRAAIVLLPLLVITAVAAARFARHMNDTADQMAQ